MLGGSEGLRFDCEGFLAGYISRNFSDFQIYAVRRGSWSIGISTDGSSEVRDKHVFGVERRKRMPAADFLIYSHDRTLRILSRNGGGISGRAKPMALACHEHHRKVREGVTPRVNDGRVRAQ